MSINARPSQLIQLAHRRCLQYTNYCLSDILHIGRLQRGDVDRYPLLELQMAQMLAAREAVGNYQPPKGDWRSASVQELIAQ
jgi:hypothetical protein